VTKGGTKEGDEKEDEGGARQAVRTGR